MTFKSLLVLGAMAAVSSTMWAQSTATIAASTEGTWENQYYLQPRNTSDYWLTSALHAGQGKANAGKFAFVEAEGDGNYYVYSVGDSKWLTYTSAANGANKITLSESKSSYFNLEKGTCTSNDAKGDKTGYVFKATGANVYMNFYEGINSNNYTTTGTVGFWQDKFGDAGSVWYVEEAPAGADWDAYQALYDQLDAYTIGEGLGEYADITKYSAGDDADLPLSYWKMYFGLTKTLEDVDSYEDYMETMQWFIDNMQINLPKAGSFLRLKGVVNNEKYLLGTKTAANAKYLMGTAKDATSVFYYDGSHLLSYSTGLYVGVSSSVWNWTAVGATGVDVNFYGASTQGAYLVGVPQTDAANAKKFVGLYSGAKNAGTADRGAFLNAAACTDNRYHWTLEEVTALPVSVSAAGYATLYAPVALTVPAGVEAYTLAFDGTALVATAVEGTIPANTGVVLAASEGSYDFEVTTGGTATSELQGTVPTIAKVENALVLGDNEGIGFYSYNGDNLAGFKAYYVAPAGSESNYRISFGELTSIISAAQQNGGQAIFDLQGRRVVEAKGINIVNGKKVIR